MGQVTSGLRRLLGRLKTYDVVWKYQFVPTDIIDYEPGIDREEADLDKANVVSSEIRDGDMFVAAFGVRHVVAIDIDHPAHLVDSSTPSHSHLYIEVPQGIPHEKYMHLLEVLADCGVIEKGYAEISIKRGHSDLRLPWVHKQDQKLASKNFDHDHLGNPNVDDEALPPVNLTGLLKPF